tara:strand:- start:2446 stop:2622 length:177 start_codon:yes stop_codon:yes gene_type:complete
MNDCFIDDVARAMDALEDFIIREEENLIETNASDSQWNALEKYKDTYKNFKYLVSIYG